MIERTFHKVKLDPTGDSGSVKEAGWKPSKADLAARSREVPEAEANVISSRVAGEEGVHAPVLDFDFPCQLIPSSTPGHFHFVADKRMTWEEYKALLLVLRHVGMIEEGYYQASIQRGATFIRKPGTKREKPRPLLIDWQKSQKHKSCLNGYERQPGGSLLYVIQRYADGDLELSDYGNRMESLGHFGTKREAKAFAEEHLREKLERSKLRLPPGQTPPPEPPSELDGLARMIPPGDVDFGIDDVPW